MIVPQVRRRAARRRRPGRPLFLGVIVLALGPLDNLVRLLVEVEACATRKEGQRDRRSDRLYSPSACDRSHPSPPEIRARSPCSAFKSPRVKAPLPPLRRINEGKRNTQPNRRLYPVGQYRRPELPRFGMSTKHGKAVRIGRWVWNETNEIRAPAVRVGDRRLQLVDVFIGRQQGNMQDGFASRPPASIPPRYRLARGLRASGRALTEPYADQRQILRFRTRASAVGDHSGRSRPAPARNGASIRRNAVWAG